MLTGATGFIGSHVAERLVREAADVRLWLREKNTFVAGLEAKGAKTYLCSGSGDASIEEAVRGADTVVHCAGATRTFSREQYFEANADLTRRILNVLQPRQKFIYISSLAAAGPSSPLAALDEHSPPRPVSHYGESKLLAEAHVRHWGAQGRNNFVILRPGVVYGPREKNLYHYFKWVAKGVLPLLGNGDRQLSLIYIDDMVEAILAACANPAAGETYFVANDDAASLLTLGEAIREALGKTRLLPLRLPAFFFDTIALALDAVSAFTRKPAVLGRQKVLELKQAAWLCSNRSLREKLRWEPRVSLDEGVRRTAEWYINEHWL